MEDKHFIRKYLKKVLYLFVNAEQERQVLFILINKNMAAALQSLPNQFQFSDAQYLNSFVNMVQNQNNPKI